MTPSKKQPHVNPWGIEPEPPHPHAGDAWTWTLRPSARKIIEPLEWIFRWIPPTAPGASFRMGARGWDSDEEPIHEVTVRQGFWLLEAPVTQAQYLAVTGKNPSYHDKVEGAAQCPVERIDWFMVRAFCERIGEQVGAALHGRWRVGLPTEAQWEYACRAGTETDYYTGDGEEALDKAGWYVGNSDNRTHPVRQKEKNRWNLYDMHGNVWEWCADQFRAEAYGERIDREVDAGDSPAYDEEDKKVPRVQRGGGYWNPARNCRSACRGRGLPDVGRGDDGFRPALLPGPVKKEKKKQTENGGGEAGRHARA